MGNIEGTEIPRGDQKIGLLDGANTVAQFEFQHDLEDGWYAVRWPNGQVDTYGTYVALNRDADKSGCVLQYIGNPWYDPTKC